MFATFSLTLCDFNPSIKLTCLRAQHLSRWVQADTVLSFVKNLYFSLPAREWEAGCPQNGCVSCYHQTCTDVIIAASACQKKLGYLQLFSAAGRKQSQVKYKHTVTCENTWEKHRSVHRHVCSHSDKEDAKGNKQKMCLQVENVTKEAEWKQRTRWVKSRSNGSTLSVPGLSTRMWRWISSKTSGSGLRETADTLCAVYSYCVDGETLHSIYKI